MQEDAVRSKKLLKNTVWSTAGYFAYALAGFISRSIFVNTLGNTITGVATLFASLLNLLSLAELGFGSAIVIHLYKPVAENDHKKTAALISLYGRVYRVMAVAVFALGMLMLPFLQFLIKTDENIESLKLYFFLYVLKSVVSYMYSYKSCVISVNQDGYKVAAISNSLLILMTVAQAAVLHFTGSFVLYLIVPIVGTLASNIVIYRKADMLIRIFGSSGRKRKLRTKSKKSSNISRSPPSTEFLPFSKQRPITW